MKAVGAQDKSSVLTTTQAETHGTRSVLATKAVETQGKENVQVATKTVEHTRQRQCLSSHEGIGTHTSKGGVLTMRAVETQGKMRRSDHAAPRSQTPSSTATWPSPPSHPDVQVSSSLVSPLSTLPSPLSTLHYLFSSLHSPIASLSSFFSPLSSLLSPLPTPHSPLLSSPLRSVRAPRSPPLSRPSRNSKQHTISHTQHLPR